MLVNVGKWWSMCNFFQPTNFWLMVFLEHDWLIFPFWLGNFIIPIDELMLFKWVGQPPTRACFFNLQQIYEGDAQDSHWDNQPLNMVNIWWNMIFWMNQNELKLVNLTTWSGFTWRKFWLYFGLGVSWVNLMPQKGVVHWRKYGDLMVIYGYLWWHLLHSLHSI